MTQTLTDLILERSYDAVVSMDEHGVVTYWNPAAESTFGIPRADAVGRTVAELIVPPRLRAAHEAGIRRFLAGGRGSLLNRRVELTALRRDDGAEIPTEIPIEMTISALQTDDRWSFHAIIADIGERKRAERERERLLDELRRALHHSERRFDAIVGQLSDPVTIRDRADRFVYANDAALRHLGVQTVEQLRETAPTAIMADYLVFDEQGGEIAMDDIPSVRILRGEEARPLLIRTVQRTTGTERWNLLKAAPLPGPGGEVEATIMIIEDVTARQRAARQARFLTGAGEMLASSLDYEQTLRNVALLAVPDIVDWCAVDLLDEDGERRQVAVAHADPARLELAERLRSYEPEELDPEQGLGLVLRTGQPVLYADIPDELLVAAAVDETHLELLRDVGFRSVAIVPMRLGRRVLGALTLVNAESHRMLDESDLELMGQLAARAAVAIENARLYSERSRIADTLQQSLLPERLPEIPGFDLAAMYIPVGHVGEVGGDFYDAWRVGEAWMVVIGDVTGKGVQAAALTALVRHTLRSASEFVAGPAVLLEHLDRTLKRQHVRSICTALCLRLDGTRATLAVGGHPLPLRLDGDGVRAVGRHGPLLGAFSDVAWEETTFDLAHGDTLIAYTDGVTDALNDDRERFGGARLTATLRTCDERSAAAIVARLTAAVREFQDGSQSDDTAAIVLHRLPSDAEGEAVRRRVDDAADEQGDPAATMEVR